MHSTFENYPQCNVFSVFFDETAKQLRRCLFRYYWRPTVDSSVISEIAGNVFYRR